MISPSDSSTDRQYEDLVRAGIASVKGGDRVAARRLLERAAALKMGDARAWIWLSATTDDPQEQRSYLEKAVAADPSNASARRGLVMLSEKLDRSRLMQEGQAVQPRQSQEPEEAHGEAYLCQKCGGRMRFDIHKEELVCQYCGWVQEVEKRLAADSAEQSVDFILPTTRAHRWAEARQKISCERCGALTLLPPGQTADRCIYCGSNRIVSSAETAELVDPQVVALMKIDEQEARDKVREWLGKGLFSPDNLVMKAGNLQLRPAYYPFWTFDGTLEVPWTCQVNEGSNRNPRWVGRSGSEYQFFDDVLVPGVKKMPDKEVAAIEPYNLKDLLAFTPEYVVGWPTLTYDYSLSDATLRSREKVISQLRAFLYARVEPGQEKRDLRTGAGKWSDLTFKHVLLPIWMGSYNFQGQEYHLMINGQTGKVGGKKPKDNIKVFTLSASAVLTLLVLAAIFFLLWQYFAGR